MRHPFQCTAIVSRSSSGGRDILLAASGPKLFALDLTLRTVTAEWPPALNVGEKRLGHSHIGGIEDVERPVKKQKISEGPASNSTITILEVAPDQQHAVVVTDDKIVRVLQIKSDGAFEELSQRCMPKRPCAVDIQPSSSDILCGDKFGDVYSIPLHPRDRDDHQPATEKIEVGKTPASSFKPAANNRTVHTKRNLRALESQMKQKGFTAKKEPLAFEHQLLLGHVSMLTDMRYASRIFDSQRRGYIITTDRDEHIRISRGPPQSYVIEGFCLGHEEFVSKVCLIPDTDLLVSGGGDDWLGVWDWTQYKLLDKISLRPLIERPGCSDVDGLQIAVSGLWTAQTPERIVVVAIEKLPMLFVVSLASYGNGGQDKADGVRASIVLLDSNPIDVTWVNDVMIVSQDTRNDLHPRLLALQFIQPSDTEDESNPLGVRRLDGEDETNISLHILNGLTDDVAVSAQTLDDLLYSVNNLRKRRDTGADIEDADGTEVTEV